LDGAGSLRVVDPRAVLGRIDSDPRTLISRGAEVARALGAGRFVSGELIGLPGRLTLTARLHDVDADAAEPAVVTAEGNAEALADLVDRVARELLTNTLSGANARIQRSAAQSSRSPDATKEFLRGEQFHRRGQFDSASAAYNRALSHDSTFALAHLMKSMNNSYTYETDDYVAAVKAHRFAGGLPERDQSLIEAFLDQQSGRLTQAEDRYLAHLKRWPHEVKALLMLGMLYQRSNPRWARPIEQARPLFERVLELEPGNVPALHNLARMDAGSRLHDSLPARAAALDEVAPGSEWAVDAKTMSDFAFGDSAAIAQLFDNFAGRSLLVRLYSIYNALRFSPETGAAVRLLSLQESGTVNAATGLPDSYYIGEELSTLTRVYVDLVGGEYDEVRDFLASPPPFTVWHVWTAELIAADIVPVDSALLQLALTRLQAVDPADRLRNPLEPLHDIFTMEVATLERDFTVSKLLGRLGRMEEAWAIQRRIESQESFLAFESLHEDAAGALAADLYRLQGDNERALEVLRALPFQLPLTAASLSITTGSHARYQRAELELEYGDPEAARLLYAGLIEGFAIPDKLFLVHAHERLGQIHEAAGRLEEALYHYGWVVGAWSNADPDLQARVAAVRERLAELREAG
jgi:tetratricopeptide (TPR) repeat protein